MGAIAKRFGPQGVRGFESGKSHVSDELQEKSRAAADVVWHQRPWRTVFLPGKAGPWHALEVGKVQEEQLWTLWQVKLATKLAWVLLIKHKPTKEI